MFSKDLPKMFMVERYINIQKMMSVQIEEMKLDGKYNIKTMISIFNSIISHKTFAYNLLERKNSKFCFFYGWWFFRKDHFNTFFDFSNKFDSCDIIYASGQPSKFNFLVILARAIKMLFFATVWIVQLLLSKHSFKESLTYLPFLATCVELKKEIKKYHIDKYAFFVTYYDLAPDQNFLIQECKNKNIITMTL